MDKKELKNLNKRVFIENGLKNLLILILAFFIWPFINEKVKILPVGNLDGIIIGVGLIAGIALASYYTYSFTKVDIRNWKARLMGYSITFFLFSAFTGCVLLIYALLSKKTPELEIIYRFILIAVYIGSIMFDMNDSQLMGTDVFSKEFFSETKEKTNNKN